MLSDLFNSGQEVSDLADDPPFLVLWALRVLSYCGASNQLLRRLGNAFDGMRHALVVDGADPPKSVDELRRVIETRRAEEEAKVTPIPVIIQRNLQLIAQFVALTPVEEQVLLARTMLRQSDILGDTLLFAAGTYVSDQRIAQVLGAALQVRPSEISNVLRPDGPLRKVGLLEVDPRLASFSERVTPLAGLCNALLRENGNADELIAFAAQRASPGTLPLSAFPHLRDEIALIHNYLVGAKQTGLTGINILLHGAPGTGKSELVRALAADLAWAPYEVVSELPSHEKVEGPIARFRRYRFLQQLLCRSGDTLVIFDEIEDVFPSSRFGEDKSPIPKAEINRVLETNPVPAFWVSNRVTQLDPAYLRRFDLIVEVGSPPRSVRKRVLEVALDQVGKNCPTIDRIAAARALTPAVLARAAKVAAHAEVDRAAAVNQLEVVLKGYRDVALAGDESGALVLPQYYDLGLVNASEPLAPVSDALARFGRGRMLLHGPPGTGKTAFANYVARQLDRPLLLKRASDIFDHWLGESEKNARRMFEEAKQEDAVLFLDEADSVLRDREGAVGRWEAPVVNEILTGMERFAGVFICATNMLDALDVASLRRFTFKIGFGWLDEEQRWRLLMESFAEMAQRAGAEDRQRAAEALQALDTLAPGDFAIVADRARLGMDFDSLETVVAALAAEQRHKPDSRRTIGF